MATFNDIILEIKQSDSYENPEHWLDRGLNPSDAGVIQLLRNATNNFLDALKVIYESSDTNEVTLQKIHNLVDELPWIELDTEEKEFLAEVIAPAIEATGNDPWEII